MRGPGGEGRRSRLRVRVAALLLVVACGKRASEPEDTFRPDTEVADSEPAVDTVVDDTIVVDTEGVDSEPPADTEVGPAPTCVAYCATVMQTCTGANANYESERACNDLCTLSGIPAGLASDTSGHTIGCRAHHAELARSGDDAAKAAACLGARFLGGGTCGDPIENFCAIDLFVCDGPRQPYVDLQTCIDAGATWQRPPDEDPNGNSLRCRLDQLVQAMLVSEASYCDGTRDPSAACPAAP